MPDSPALTAAIAAWLAAKSGRSASVATARAYAATLEAFRAVAQAAGFDLDGPVPLLAGLAQTWAAARDPAPATHNQRLAIVSSFYAYAAKQGVLEGANPIARVERRRTTAPNAAAPLAPEAVTASLAAIDRATLAGARDYALLAVALATGRRVGEVAGLRWGDLTVHGEQLDVVWRRCKGNKQMRNTLPAGVSRAVAAWLRVYYGTRLAGLPPETPVWVSLATNGTAGGPLSAQALEAVCARRLGTSKFHCTRHTFAVSMEDVGAKLTTIQEELGHASASTTAIYLKSHRRPVNPQMDALAALLGLAG